MALISWSKAKRGINLALKANLVPVLVGHAGIGKTEICQQIAEENNFGWVKPLNISNTKEGEMSMPFIAKIDGKPVVVYAPHSTLEEAKRLAENEYKDSHVLLLIDELNRGDTAVITEGMQLIQSRRINNFELPDNVKIICAMNPSADMDDFEESDYAVTSIDNAIIDRGAFFYIDADPDSWIDWATGQIKINGEIVSRVEEKVYEFIESNKPMLHQIKSTEYNKPTPRSWFKVSEAYRAMINNNEFDENDFRLVSQGLVGSTATHQFLSFLRKSTKPLLKPSEIFANNGLSKEHKYKLEKEETNPRRTMIAKSCIHYVITERKRDNFPTLIQLIDIMPGDIKIMLMKGIKRDYPKLHNELIKNNNYQDAFFELIGKLIES